MFTPKYEYSFVSELRTKAVKSETFNWNEHQSNVHFMSKSITTMAVVGLFKRDSEILQQSIRKIAFFPATLAIKKS